MIENDVRKIVVDLLGVSESEVTLDASLIEDLNADSLDAVDLASTLEDHFEIQVADEEIMNLTTVGKIVEFVRARRPELDA